MSRERERKGLNGCIKVERSNVLVVIGCCTRKATTVTVIRSTLLTITQIRRVIARNYVRYIIPLGWVNTWASCSLRRQGEEMTSPSGPNPHEEEASPFPAVISRQAFMISVGPPAWPQPGFFLSLFFWSTTEQHKEKEPKLSKTTALPQLLPDEIPWKEWDGTTVGRSQYQSRTWVTFATIINCDWLKREQEFVFEDSRFVPRARPIHQLADMCLENDQ